MKVKGSELKFISRIRRDGSGTESVRRTPYLQDSEFELNRLSISNNTYIASGFNSYVVKWIKR